MKKAFLLILFFNIFYTNAQLNSTATAAIDFKIKNAGINVNGSFTNVKTTVIFDESHLQSASLVGIAQANSINTGIALRDRHLKEKEEFFNVKEFPVLNMKSVTVTKKSNNIYAVSWDLTIKGITKRLNAELLTKPQNDGLLMTTEFKINRNDWDIGGNSLFMSDIVAINLKFLLRK
jgi:polyisoprenoid-binding protein YceI